MVVEMCKGSDIGKYTGIYYMFSMSSQIVTPIVSGALLEHVSYRTLFPYAVIFSVASLCTMLFVKHGDSRPPRKKDMVENFDVED
jgi:MFS family permease